LESIFGGLFWSYKNIEVKFLGKLIEKIKKKHGKLKSEHFGSSKIHSKLSKKGI
jgi:hypothetical protein